MSDKIAVVFNFDIDTFQIQYAILKYLTPNDMKNSDGIPIQWFNCSEISEAPELCKGCETFIEWSNRQRDSIITTALASGYICKHCSENAICGCIINEYDNLVREIAKSNCKVLKDTSEAYEDMDIDMDYSD